MNKFFNHQVIGLCLLGVGIAIYFISDSSLIQFLSGFIAALGLSYLLQFFGKRKK